MDETFGTTARGKNYPKGTTNGTTTDVNGNYSIEVPENAVLQISFIEISSFFIIQPFISSP